MESVITPQRKYKAPQRIKIESVTEYFAKKRLVQEALIYFHDLPGEASVLIESKSEAPLITKKVSLNRFKKVVGYDFTKEWSRLCADKNLIGKPNILNVFDQL